MALSFIPICAFTNKFENTLWTEKTSGGTASIPCLLKSGISVTPNFIKDSSDSHISQTLRPLGLVAQAWINNPLLFNILLMH